MLWILRIVLLPIVLCGLGISARAQTDGKILFVNPQTDVVFYAGVNEVGLFKANPPFVVNLSPPQTLGLMAAPIGFLALHPGSSDLVVCTDGVNPPALFVGDFPNFGAADIYVNSGPFLFYYHASSAPVYGGVIQQTANGDWNIYWHSSNFNAWDTIVGTKNYLYFYNTATGDSATGKINSDGSFVTTDARNIGIGPTKIASVDDNILMYNPNGSWLSGPILYRGSALTDGFRQAATQTSNSFLDPGYTDILEVDKHLVFYSKATGKTAIGHFDRLGVFFLDSKPTIAKGWTNVLRSGRYLLLYNSASGNAQIGFVSLDGKYTITQKLNIGLGYTLAASTLN